MLGGRIAEAVNPVLPLPLNSQDKQAESSAQTRHGTQTRYKMSKEKTLPIGESDENFLQEQCGTETRCAQPQRDAPPTPCRWGRRMMMRFKAQPPSGAEKTQCVAPSSSVLSAPREETSSAVLHTSDLKLCCSVQHQSSSCTLPLIQWKTQKLLEHHRCSKRMPSTSCIFYERNGQ